MTGDTLFFFIAIIGLLAAIAIFLLAIRFVTEARRGNRHLREARRDPHCGRVPGTTPGERRDIGQ